MELPHATVETPVFMPVGTQGTLKGLLTEQLEKMDCRIMLGNTYHLGNRCLDIQFFCVVALIWGDHFLLCYFRPGVEVLEAAGGLHKY